MIKTDYYIIFAISDSSSCVQVCREVPLSHGLLLESFHAVSLLSYDIKINRRERSRLRELLRLSFCLVLGITISVQQHYRNRKV